MKGEPVEDGEVVTVRDQALVGSRYIVRSAHGEGFWHFAAGLASRGAHIPAAVFQPDPSASFTFPRR